jgi:hypothetical protein
MRKISVILVCLCIAVLSGCANNKEVTPQESDSTTVTTVSSIDGIVMIDDDDKSAYSMIKKGIWWAVNSDYTIKDMYYYFDGNGSGSYLSQSDGKGSSFTYDISDNSLNIHVKNDDALTYFVSEGINGDLILSNGTNEDTLSYQGDKDFADFHFYNNDELIEMGKKYYLKSHDELTTYIDAEIWQDGSIALHFYYVGETNTATIEWYVVDRFTAKGKDLLENDIDLTEVLQ